MIKFTKPGTQGPYEVMAAKAIKDAVNDSNIDFKDIQQAYLAMYMVTARVVRQHYTRKV